MRIEETLGTLRAEGLLRKTPSGRPLTDYAISAIDAALEDRKNWETNAVICRNCCIIISGLLVPEGCVNCGSKDLTTEITQADIL